MIGDITSFFQKSKTNSSNPPEILNWDCDGIVLFEENGKKYFFLVELKSSFDSRDLYHGMHQIISSYIKTNMLLQLLASYNKDEYIFKAFIACYPPNPEYKRILHKQLQMPSSSKYKTEAEFTSELYICKKVEFKATDCMKLKSVNLGKNCLFHSLPFYFIEIPRPNNSIDIDIKNYL